jgi:poly(A) polymerase
MQMMNPVSTLKNAGYQSYFWSYSALDRYFRVRAPGPEYLLTEGSLIDLARTFEDITYPGLLFTDAALRLKDGEYLFRCIDTPQKPSPAPFTVQELRFDPERNVFLDPQGIYPGLRQKSLISAASPADDLFRLAEAARLVSRYTYEIRAEELKLDGSLPEPTFLFQHDLLVSLLSAGNPAKGLKLLFAAGFVESFWPQLFKMAQVPHVKDYHPEGNAWEHTLATFAYRKESDLTLSLALLFHDIGKPATRGTQERPFDGHADLGARLSTGILRRLGFAPSLVEDVGFLIRFHMMPAALKQLPLYRTRTIMSSPLFPRLLELYRADISASYWSPQSYYDACRVYRSFLKNRGNPYRRADGRKQSRPAGNSSGSYTVN